MKIELKPGEYVSIVFEDTDGEIEVSYSDKPDHGRQRLAGITVQADMPDVCDRHGIIYHAPFFDNVMVAAIESDDMKTLVNSYAWHGSVFPIADCFSTLKQYVTKDKHEDLKQAIKARAEEYNSTLE